MTDNPAYLQQLLAENDALRARLHDAEETLRAIQSGEVDALVLSSTEGDNILDLKGGQESYRVMVEAMGEGAVTLAPDGTLLYGNSRFAEWVKLPREQIVGLALRGLIAGEERKRFDAMLSRGAQTVVRETLTLQAADGTQTPALFSMSPLPQREGEALFVVIADLSEVAAATAARSRLALIVESSDDAIVSTTLDGVVESWNRAAEQLFGYSADEAIGRPLQTLIIPPEQVEEVSSRLDAIRRGEHMERVESMQRRKDGSLVEVSVTYFAILAPSGDVVGISINTRDITARKQAEKSLMLFRTLLDQSNDAIEVLEPSTLRFIDVNETECRMLGYGREELLAMSAFDIDPELTPERAKGMEELLRQKGRAHFETEHQRKDGSTFPVEIHSTRVELDKPYNLSIARDITERKATERALQKYQNQLSQALEIAKIGYWEYEFRTDEFIFNDQYYRLHKITAEEAGGYRMSATDFARRYVHPEDAPIVGKNIRLAFESRDPDYTAKIEARLLSGEGEIVWAEVRFRIDKDQQGKTNRLIGINQDLTVRKQAELKLLESERRFTDLLDNVELVSMMLDREARITYCNDYLLRLTGWQQKEVIGQNWWDLFVPAEIQDLKDGFFAALLDNQPEALHHENDIVTRSGERKLIRWNNSVLRSAAGDVIGTASIGEDITEQTKSQANIKYLNRVLSVLSGINALIVRTNDREELFREACNIAVKEGEFRMAMIVIVDQGTMLPVSITSAGKDDELLASIKNVMSSSEGMHTTLIARVVKERKSHHCE